MPSRQYIVDDTEMTKEVQRWDTAHHKSGRFTINFMPGGLQGIPPAAKETEVES